MTINPTPRRIFTFTPQEFDNLDFSRFQLEIAAIRNLPAAEIKRLMGRYIIYPRVLSGTISYARILSDPKMRTFIRKASELFPEWMYFIHPKNPFAPIQLYGQLEEILVIEGLEAMTSRISSPRTSILMSLLDSLAPAQKFANSYGVPNQRFAAHIREVFSLARLELVARDETTEGRIARPKRKLLISHIETSDQAIQRIKDTFSSIPPKLNRASFGFEMILPDEDALYLSQNDWLTRFFDRVFHEVPESIYYLHPSMDGLIGIVNCSLQLQAVHDKLDSSNWHVCVTEPEVLLRIMHLYPTLRKMDQAYGFTKEDTVEQIERTLAGFQLKLAPPLGN